MQFEAGVGVTGTRKCFSYGKNNTGWQNFSHATTQAMPNCVTEPSVCEISVDAEITQNQQFFLTNQTITIFELEMII